MTVVIPYLPISEDGLPAPVAQVSLSNPDPASGKAESLTVDALLDAGSDYCMISETIVNHLGLTPIYEDPDARVQTGGGLRRGIQVFAIEVGFPAGRHLHVVEALATDVPYVVIGRNLLDEFKICFDGPNQCWSVEISGAGQN